MFLSVFLFVCPKTNSISRSLSQNVTNKRCLVCVLGHTQTLWVHDARKSQAMYIKIPFSVLPPLQCQSLAIVCVSTPWMYLHSGYFIVLTKDYCFHDTSSMCVEKSLLHFEVLIGFYTGVTIGSKI